MLIPWVGVAWCIRFYRMKRPGQGKAAIVASVAISLLFAALAVHLVTMLLELEGDAMFLAWGGLFGYFLLSDIVYLRMMLFTKWAKRRMGVIAD